MTLRIIPRNFHDEATVAAQFAPVAGFGVEDTQNTKRTRAWRATDGTDIYVQGTYADGVTRTASGFAFFRHWCHGGNVRLRLFSDASYTTQVYDSGANPIINITSTAGFDFGINPWGAGAKDPFIRESPYWLWFAPTAHLSYRIYFTNFVTTFGRTAWQVCRFWLGQYIQPSYTALFDAPLGHFDLTDKTRSRSGSSVSNVGPNGRELSIDIKRVPESEAAGWLDVKHYVGTGRDVVLSLFVGKGDRKERDNFFDCKLKSLDPLVRWDQTQRFLSTRLQIEEV